MLTEEQIEAIAEDWYPDYCYGCWYDLDWEKLGSEKKDYIKKGFSLAINKAIAIQVEQDRRSFIAVGKYIGVTFTSKTDVVSEVYKKLEEIMTVFREHSQEIAIAQQIKHLTNLLEKYGKQQEASRIQAGAVGTEEGVSVRN